MNRIEELLEAIERRKNEAIERRKNQEQTRPLFDPNILPPQQIVLTVTSDGPGVERLCDIQPSLIRQGAFNN